jgi:hypothetical protein
MLSKNDFHMKGNLSPRKGLEVTREISLLARNIF